MHSIASSCKQQYIFFFWPQTSWGSLTVNFLKLQKTCPSQKTLWLGTMYSGDLAYKQTQHTAMTIHMLTKGLPGFTLTHAGYLGFSLSITSYRKWYIGKCFSSTLTHILNIMDKNNERWSTISSQVDLI